MKKFSFIILLLLYSNTLFAQEEISFIDIDLVLSNSNYGKKVVQKLKNKNDQNILELENSEIELKKIEEDINKVKNIISEDELNKKISELKNKIVLYREEKDLKFKEYNSYKNKELEFFFKKITPFVEEFMELNSIKIIIEKKNIFIAKANYDRTDELINFLNLKIKND